MFASRPDFDAFLEALREHGKWHWMHDRHAYSFVYSCMIFDADVIGYTSVADALADKYPEQISEKRVSRKRK